MQTRPFPTRPWRWDDLLVISGGLLAVGIVIWSFLGNPNHAPRMHAAQEMTVDPNLKLISERSPYMRTER